MADHDLTRRLLMAAQRVAPRAARVTGRLGVMARLGRVDASLVRVWLRNVGPLGEEVGPEAAATYTELVLATAPLDLDVARTLVAELPDRLAGVAPDTRRRYAGLLRAVLDDRPAALPLVMRTLPTLMAQMDDRSLAGYLAQALVLHAESPDKAESYLRLESHQSQAQVSALVPGTDLASVRRTLTLYARAHCGETVQVRPGAQAFTDGRHVYLPERIDRFGDERDFLAYRVLTARNAGHIEFGTLDLDLDRVPADGIEGGWLDRQPDELELERMLRSFPNRALARDLFRILEDARVEARVREEYPGVARDMDRLAQEWRAPRPEPAGLAPAEQAVEWLARVAWGQDAPSLPDSAAEAAARSVVDSLARVRAPGSTVETSVIELLRAYAPVDALLWRVDESKLRRLDGTPQDGGADYQGLVDDPLAGGVRPEALSDEDREVEARTRAILEHLREDDPQSTVADAREQARREGSTYEEMADFLDRNQAPAGPAREQGPEREEEAREGGEGTGPVQEGAEAVVGSFVYPEWDARIDDYKPRWVHLTEYLLAPGSPEFVEQVRDEHGALIGQVRRAFEALRPDELRRLRGLPDGDEIDVDRAVQARIEWRAHGVGSDRIYMRRLRDDRDVEVAFLLDLSSSTNELVDEDAGRVIDIEKKALVLIAEAVEAIGDSCAIFGFSGYGKDQVAFYVAKDFDDPWDDQACERVGRMSWKMENRDGAAIRHATSRLTARGARIKLLILLSDGKPLDCGCDHYADEYAQEDTRVALVEARAQGVHPFCITVDPRGSDYLARMYGEGGYTVITHIESLPQRLPLIYRRLTR